MYRFQIQTITAKECLVLKIQAGTISVNKCECVNRILFQKNVNFCGYC